MIFMVVTGKGNLAASSLLISYRTILISGSFRKPFTLTYGLYLPCRSPFAKPFPQLGTNDSPQIIQLS